MEHAERSADTGAESIRLPALSPNASAFLRRHPNEAQLAVIAALEAAAVHFKGPTLEEGSVPEALRPFLTDGFPPVDLLIGAEEAAQRLNVTRQTIYSWIEAGRLIGWRLTKQGLQIPVEQILGPGELVSGLEELLKLIPEPRAAWRFLNEESSYFEIPVRPIAALKARRIGEVLAAASAWGDAFT